MKVVVASTNPVKVGAVRDVFARAFPDRQVDVQGQALEIDLPDQPLGDVETRNGAVARAHHVLATTDAEVGVGLEGGVAFEAGEACLIGWCAIATRDGVLSVSHGASMPLPPSVARDVAAGRELGPVMDELTAVHNSKRGLGAVGYFTCGLLPRQKSWEYTVTCALVKLLRPELYAEGGECRTGLAGAY